MEKYLDVTFAGSGLYPEPQSFDLSRQIRMNYQVQVTNLNLNKMCRPGFRVYLLALIL